MRANRSAKPTAARQSGILSLREGCPALMLGDGRRFWLELEMIPFDLVDRAVHVEGTVHQQNLIVVDRIGLQSAGVA